VIMLKHSFYNIPLSVTNVAVLLFVGVLFSPLAAATESCSTKDCHGNILQYTFLHTPVKEGDCLQCHQKQADADKHPPEQEKKCTVRDEGEALCLRCHDSFAGQFEHGPAASGACTACHNPHGSNEKNLLHAPLQDLCLGCHEELADSISKAVFIHSAISDLDCSACHLPHSSGFAYLLKGETSESCFECHRNIEDKFRRSLHKHDPLYLGNQCANCHLVHYSNYSALLKWDGNNTCFQCHSTSGSQTKTAQASKLQMNLVDKKFIHEPIENTGCPTCHDVHGSRYVSLLTEAFPHSIYAGFTQETYALCFQCHDKDLLTERNRTTDFRNGSTNLHFVHVADKLKGRTCKTCHNLHASNGKKLINLKGIPFGDWSIPIRFEATDGGGSCMPGCHRAMKYDRKKKVDNSKEAVESEKNKAEELKNGTSDGVVQPESITIIRRSYSKWCIS